MPPGRIHNPPSAFSMELKFILESLLFSAQKPLSLKELRDVFAAAAEHAEGDDTVKALKKMKESDLTAALEELAKEHEAGAAQLPAGLRGRLVAIRDAAGIRAVAQGAGRRARRARRGSRSPRWKRSPSSPIASRSRARRSSRSAA